MIELELKFDGSLANNGLLDFYDAARALTGFQRSLALTTHLVLNGEIITQAPSLVGAQLLIPAVEPGSWKSRVFVSLGMAFAAGSVGKDSPVGQVVTSVYDYVLSETMGFHVDYEKTLQQQYFEHLDGKKITAEKIDSLAEKIEANVADMHRPIAISGTANRADIHLGGPFGRKLGPDFTLASYEYVRQTVRLEAVDSITGYVSSYNINTYSGRLFCIETKRPIPFELLPEARTAATVGVLTRSQHFNGQKRFDPRALIVVKAHRLNSNKGKLKRLQVTEASAGDSVLG